MIVGMATVDTTAVLDAPLQDMAGSPCTLRAQLGAPSTVVVFLRHFG